ncbi:MAG: hypothetical protein KA191_09845 [Verrucomicrobia bacterium]|jgi:hypothetical protein|nr:hypothetical protein [Verrucomicrobiota bacterium]OQC67867.1 MAG: hypothetical protein BWX48_00444 [Verrucomicrobia bacterium ADurb.Bin006]MDI9382154.1 hypothetical protein [Verrucomicrobiota bacterium]NMD20547.1 hypothetical protein [Verrucomicrobiota bacterium]HNV00756.1 hypothetical protein [Verrucomicrobiota bacterium]
MKLHALLISLIACGGGCVVWPLNAHPAPTALAEASAQVEARLKSPDWALSWHWVGTTRLAGNTNGTEARVILAQPASQRMLRTTLEKLARSPGAWLAPGAATNPPAASLLIPWIEELVASQSCGGIVFGAEDGVAIVAAVRVSNEKRNTLESTWLAWAGAADGTTPTEVQTENAKVRETRFAQTQGWSRVGCAGDWALIGMGTGSAAPFVALAKRVAGLGAPEGWLEIEADGPKVAQILGWPEPASWPAIGIQIEGRGPILRTTASLTYSTPLDLKLDPWRIPTHTLGDPVVGFTALRGIRPWLSRQAWWKQLELPTTPNQAVGWTIAEIPFASYVAWEAPEVTNVMTQLGPKVSAVLERYIPKVRFGDAMFQTNTTRLAWTNLPIAEPFVSPATAQDPGFAVAGLFPLVKTKRPLPPELLSQIMDRIDLVYYSWELTAQRVNGWRHIKNLYWMLAGYAPLPTNYTGEAWLFDTNVVDRLGNTGTELRLESPRHLVGVRNSALGLSGLELVALMRWLDDPDFPRLSEPAARPALLHRMRARQTGKPGAGVPPASPAPSNAPAAPPVRPSP